MVSMDGTEGALVSVANSNVSNPAAVNPDTTNPNNLNAASDLWTEIVESWNHFKDYCDTVSAGIRQWFRRVGITIWNGIPWVYREMVKPFFVSGVNVFGYLVDKFLMGSPGLRPYLHDGLLKSDIPDRWRNFVKENSGWDIYEKSHPAVNNVLGILGAGVGVLNFFNHLVTSIYYNTRNYFHVLGKAGVIGEANQVEDKRNLVVKTIFGILSAPIFLPPLLVTNLVDGVCAFAKNMALSFAYNLASSFNSLLDKDGLFSDSSKQFDDASFGDKRQKVTKIIYGILSAPLVAPFALVTNALDFALLFPSHFGRSLLNNLGSTYNLLGDYGSFGKRYKIDDAYYEDERLLRTKILYGILSAPLVLPFAVLTNTVDAAFTFGRQFLTSFHNNLLSTFNLLGKHGVMGPRYKLDDASFEDKRSLAAKITYGILSAPVVLPLVVVTNVIDGLATFTRHMARSFWNNLRSSYNFLGHDGIFGPGYRFDDPRFEDNRSRGEKIAFGILSAPLVAPFAMVTNIIDWTWSLPGNLKKSFWNNIRSSYNLLSTDNIFNENYKWDDARFNDKRSRAAKIIYGMLSAPFVLPVVVFTNTVDVLLSLPSNAVNFAKNIAKSFWNNLRSSYNLLGEDGTFKKSYQFDDASFNDQRSKAKKIMFGILSVPFVAPFALVTNSVDFLLSLPKNLGRSFWNNLRSTFNLLGSNGVFKPNYKFDDASFGDNRKLGTKIIHGILSAPLVFPFALVTNTVDAVCSFSKNMAISFWNNLRSSFNLLGANGVFKPNYKFDDASFEDNRHKVTKVIYGILSAPLVLPFATVTNVVDAVSAFAKNMAMSFWNNLRSTYNLLGSNGVFKPNYKFDDASFQDNRHKATKVVYGILSAPLVLPFAVVTNVIDGIAAFTKNMAVSFWNNLRSSYNLLGEKGIYQQARRQFDDASFGDQRQRHTKIIYGILSAPLVAPFAILTNVIDLAIYLPRNLFTAIKNVGISFWNNLRSTVNFLGKDGCFGERYKLDDPLFADQRSRGEKILYSVLSAPFVLPFAVLGNVVDGLFALPKNFYKSLKNNLRATYNLLGNNGVFGERHKFEDNRGMLAKVMYGVVSLPLVAPLALISNTVDAIGSLAKNMGLSFWRNLRTSYTVFGNYGVMGPSHKYEDPRSLATKLVCGAMTLPFVAAASLVTNVIDGVCAYFKNWERTIKDPALIGASVFVGITSPVPFFMLRKVVIGLYNVAVMPWKDKLAHKDFNGWRFAKNIANVVTAGGFSAVKKVFEKITGYSSRFGFPTTIPGDQYNQANNTFRDAIRLAAKGEFPGVKDGKRMFRPFLHLVYGFRHKVEDILKALHDAYMEYAKQLTKAGEAQQGASYNLNSFFNSKNYSDAVGSIKLREGEEAVLHSVEDYLRRPAMA